MIQHFAKNELGRDFVVGDLHGGFSLLEARLKEIGFDKDKDRLFSVGDMVDRGPESTRVLEFLAKPWFKAVRGNHEQMAINAEIYEGSSLLKTGYRHDGGDWFISMLKEERKPYVEAFEKLPIIIEVETNDGLVGIIHAECPLNSWPQLIQYCKDNPSDLIMANTCMSSRNRYKFADATIIEGIQCLIVGHTIVVAPTQLGNTFYIDTGAFKTNNLTIVRIT